MKNEKFIPFDVFNSYSRIFEATDNEIKSDYDKYVRQFKYLNFLSGKPTRLQMSYQTQLIWDFDFDLHSVEDWHIDCETLFVKFKSGEKFYEYGEPDQCFVTPFSEKISLIYQDE